MLRDSILELEHAGVSIDLFDGAGKVIASKSRLIDGVLGRHPPHDDVGALRSTWIDIEVHKENVLEIIETLEPYGITLHGQKEESKGMKVFDGIADLIELLETEL